MAYEMRGKCRHPGETEVEREEGEDLRLKYADIVETAAATDVR